MNRRNCSEKQSNQEFLDEKKRNGTGVYHPRETRTCFKCNEVGHIAWNCPKNANTKQGVSEKLKEKVDVEPPTEKFKFFENSIHEVGECSKKDVYKKKAKDNQVWVVKQVDEKVGDDSSSTKPEEPQGEVKEVNSVFSVSDDEFPSLKFEEIKKKVGKVEISDQFYSEKSEFDVEKTFNGNVKKIFGKMLDGKAKGVKDFYATKMATYNPTEQELRTPKSEETWVEILFS
ncbi:putative transcription factor interactor and regulator CCHC(Zn) family [Helianthus debilis subsp. tardiflorus]